MGFSALEKDKPERELQESKENEAALDSACRDRHHNEHLKNRKHHPGYGTLLDRFIGEGPRNWCLDPGTSLSKGAKRSWKEFRDMMEE